MPRIPRSLENRTSFFHIMAQGIGKEYIFEKTKYKLKYQELMLQYSKEYEIEIISYCIMDNHVHLLIKCKDNQVMSKFMHGLNTSFAHYYNKREERVGYVFRNRFKSQMIKNEGHLFSCIWYIYQNPVKAGIVEKAERYPYSNGKEYYLRKIEKRQFQNQDDYFLEVEEELKKEIQNYLKRNNIVLEEKKKDKMQLKEFVIFLKKRYHMSHRKIAQMLQIDRKRIDRIIK